ncbi:MAG TPA: pitrilysin family protein [Anaerolineae bacterium]|nr:pitrilysin family protein [Anaerolineae bacterium]
MSDRLAVLDQRPLPGTPRAYDFPAFGRSRLDNGLTLIRAHVPGRPLLQAQLLVRGDAGGGATSEPPTHAGVTVLAARAMSEGTVKRDAVAFVEACERLGAEMGANAGWDSLTVQVEVPRAHLAPAMTLFAEMTLQPSFPARETERLREERLNDLAQVMADARRRAEKAFPEVIYAPGVAYARPSGGVEETVAHIDREAVVTRHAELLQPDACTLIVCGDLDGVPLDDIVASAFGSWAPDAVTAPDPGPAPDGRGEGRRVVLVDRPGAPQSEIRIGHVGTPRRIDDFHALSVTNALLGGLFNSRLNLLLREQRGYTYGVNSGFEMRRAAGPFAVRCAVESDVTAPAIADIMAELDRIREAPVAPDELDAARDYLVGVFPLRFETSAQVAAALAGLVVHELPDDELDRYRPTIAAVSAEDVRAAAVRHIHPEQASIVVVGDVSRFEPALRAAAYGEVEVVIDDGFRGAGGA